MAFLKNTISSNQRRLKTGISINASFFPFVWFRIRRTRAIIEQIGWKNRGAEEKGKRSYFGK